MNEDMKRQLEHNKKRMMIITKMILFSIFIGIAVGYVSIAFYILLNAVTELRTSHPWYIYFLPFGGLVIVWLYRVLHNENDTGTNLVLSGIHSDAPIPLRMAPLIFISTLITHLFGGSAGREGAALQLGGSIGNYFGNLFHLEEKERHIMIMCGMSAAFSTLFGTPMAAAIFSMEVVSIGIMHYAALVPCVLAALIGHGIADYYGFTSNIFQIDSIPEFGLSSALIAVLLAILCALVSILFCITLHSSSYYFKRFFKNPYVRVAVGGCIIVILTLLVGSFDYNGTGVGVITKALDGTIAPEAFLLKIFFTAITLGCGYKGGEIVPTFFIGASFGCLFGNLIGFSPTLCTAIGMTSVFCGVTNCPITSLLISFEMFGYDGMPYYLLAIAFSYMFSGYFSLYSSQKIIYSKFHPTFINKKAH